MRNIGKMSIFISIVLILLLAVSSVNAEDISISDDDADLASIEEDLTFENVNMDDDVCYESNDMVADEALDYEEDEVSEANSKSNLGANQLSATVGTFKDLENEINNAEDVLNLSRDYKFSNATDFNWGVIIRKNITINGGGHTLDAMGEKTFYNTNVGIHFSILGDYAVILNDLNLINGNQYKEGGSIRNNNGNLTINNCNFTNNTADWLTVVNLLPSHEGGYGGAIYNRGGTVTINNSNFNNNVAVFHSAGKGGAIYNLEGTIIVTGSNFTNNQGPADGGAIFNWYGTATIKDCQFNNNSVEHDNPQSSCGGAICNDPNSIMTIENCNFTNNYGYVRNAGSQASGGAIYNYDRMTIVGCVFSGNYIQDNYAKGDGGAIYNDKSGNLNIADSIFIDNHANGNGGAISNINTMVISDSNFTGNYANTGDAIYNNKKMELSNNNVTGSKVGIYSTSESTIVSPIYADILDNQSLITFNPTVEIYGVLRDDAGNLIQYTKFKFSVDGQEVPYSSFDQTNGIYKGEYTFKNPGTYVISTNLNAAGIATGQITFNNPLSLLQELIDNAGAGDEINISYGYAYLESFDHDIKNIGITVNKDIILNGNGVTIDGADVSRLFKITNNANLVLNNITLANGYSTSGGAAYIEAGSLSLTNSLVINNSADYQGGAIYSNGNLEISNSSFENNRASSSYGMGGAIYSAQSCLISDVNFTENSGRLGGAIYSGNDMKISNSTFNNNRGGFGGALFASGNLDISDSSFRYGNASSSGGAISFDTLDAKLTADNVSFVNNTASYGGAIDLTATADISNSHFENNSANDNGGAINNGGILSISCSNFTDNSAGDKGQAIYNDKELYLISNQVSSSTVAIYNSGRGNINGGQVSLTFTDSEVFGSLKHNITAIIRDANDNLLEYENFTFMVDGETVPYTSFDEASGEYKAEYTFNDIGTYEISAKFNEMIVTVQRTIVNSLSLLQYFIDNAEGNSIDLEYDFLYNEAVDYDLKDMGVVVNKTMVINGNRFDIDGKGYSRLFNVTEGGNLTLNELGLINGFAYRYGGAVCIDKNSTLNINMCNIQDNRADYGGAIYQSGNASIYLNNSRLSNNRAYFDGPAICIDASDDNEHINPFDEDELVYGRLIVDHSSFEFNSGVGYGAAIYINNSNIGLSLNDSGFIYNDGRYGGAIYSNGEANISNSHFKQNRGTWFGGALYLDSNSSATVDECIFEECISENGGAIYSKGTLILSASNFTNNEADLGTAISNAGNLTLSDSVFATDLRQTPAIYNGGILNLSNNNITGSDIHIQNNKSGNIMSWLNVALLGGEDKFAKSAQFNLTGVLSDDMGNIIYDENFTFLVEGQRVPCTSFDVGMGAHIAEHTFPSLGTYLISADYENAEISTGRVLMISLILLKQLIDENTNGTIDMEFDYPYIPEFDESIVNGIVINKSITLNGKGHIINGSEMARIFNITADGKLTLNNLTIANAYNSGSGGAIYIDGGELTINDSNFTKNIAGSIDGSSFGGAIYVKTGSLTVNSSNFTENSAGAGGVIYSESPDNIVKISGCEFTKNNASSGGAIGNVGEMTINGSRFINNRVVNLGGVIYGGGLGIKIDHCEFMNNTAQNGGVIAYMWGTSEFSINNTLFESNNASIQGGAIYFAGLSLNLENLSFINNTAPMSSAVYLGSGDMTIKHVDFIDNKANEGGAIDIGNTAKASIKDSTFAGNIGGAETYNIQKAQDSTLTLENNTFKTTYASINTDKLVYASNEEVKINGSFIWGLNETVIDFRFTEIYNSVYFYPANFKSGKFNFAIRGFRNGIYALNIITFTDSNGNTYIVNSTPTDTFSVGDVRLKVSLEINDTNIANDVIANAYIYEENSNAPIKYLDLVLVVDGTEYGMTSDERGRASKNLGRLNLQNHTGFLVFKGNEVFNSDFSYDGFRVVDTPKLSVNIEDIEFGEDAIATLTLMDSDNQGMTAPVELRISGFDDPFIVIVGEGRGTLTISGLNAGSYTYTASFAETGNYLANVTEEKTFTVRPLSDLEIGFDQNKINYGDIVNGTVSVRNQSGEAEVSNVAIVIKNGDETVYETAIGNIDGNYNFVYGDELLAPGHYTIVITVPAQGTYPQTSKSFDLEVSTTPLDVSIGLDDVFYGQEIILNVSVGNYNASSEEEEFIIKNLTGTARIIVSGIDDDFTLEIPNCEIIEGKAQVNLTEHLAVGRYNVQVIVDVFGYDADSAQYELIVSKDQTSISVSVDNIKYGENATVAIRLSARYSEKLNETVNVIIDGVEYESKVTENGTASFEVSDLNAGIHSILLSFDGNGLYMPSSAYASFNVSKQNPIIKLNGSTVEYGDVSTVNINVTDEKGNPIGGTVIVVVDWHDGTSLSIVKLDENGTGQATFRLDLDGAGSGTWDARATYLQGDNYASAEKATTVTVADSTELTIGLSAEEVTFGSDTIISITAIDGSGALITLNKVNVSIGDGEAKGYDLAGGTVNLGKLNAGETEVTVSVLDGFHKYASNATVVKVNPAVPDLSVSSGLANVSIEVRDGTGPIGGIASITVDCDRENPITIIIDETGKAEVPLGDLAPGNHTVEVTFNNDNYVSATQTVVVNVPKASNATIEIKPVSDSFAYGEDVIINVTVKDGETGLSGIVVLSIAGTDYSLNLTGGFKQAVIKGLEHGTYDVTARFLGNDDYAEADASPASLVVKPPAKYDVTVTGSEVSYGENSTITVLATGDDGNPLVIGEVNVIIDDNDPVLLPVALDGTVDLGKLNASSYNVTVIVDDGVHGLVSRNTTVKVNQGSGVQILLDIPEQYHYLDDVELNITVMDRDGNLMDARVNIQIDGVVYMWFLNITGGKVSIPMERFMPGMHIVRVMLLNDNYLETATEAPFYILKDDPDLIVKADSIKEGGTAKVELELFKDIYYVDGYVVVTVNDVDYSIYIPYGDGILEIDNLPAGNYSVSAHYIGNDYFEESFAETSLEVSEYSNVSVNIGGGTESIVLNLTDSKGRPVNGTVNVTIDGTTKEVPIVNGTATVPVPSGNHNVTVSYPGDANHPGNTVNKVVYVNKKAVKKIATKITYSKKQTITYNKKLDNKKHYYITATLKDANGKALAGKKVKVYYHGKSFTTKTNAKGQFKFRVAHKIYGECTQVLSFAGDEKYADCFTPAYIKVKKQKVKLTAKKKTFKAAKKVKKFTAILKNSKGKAIKGKKIVFIVNKKKYTAKTNKKGKAVVKLKLSKKKTYKVKVKFSGDSIYAKKTKRSKVKIK